MQLKFVTGIAIILVLLLACSGNTNGFQSRESPAIKVVVDQAKDGVVPVEIIQPMVVSSAPNKLDELTYVLRNTSTKRITAVALVRTISFEENGKTYSDSIYSTMDTAFHPDFGGKPLMPEGQMSMEGAGPLSFYEGVIIKEVILTLNYVSFDDQTAYGAGGEGERLIKGIRDGARRYKGWLAQEYSRAGNLLATIFPQIQAPDIPEALKLDANQSMGATRYRLSLLKTLKTKGAADVENYLKQNQ